MWELWLPLNISFSSWATTRIGLSHEFTHIPGIMSSTSNQVEHHIIFVIVIVVLIIIGIAGPIASCSKFISTVKLPVIKIEPIRESP